jgi:hypothetical protein
MDPITPEGFFADSPHGLAVYRHVLDIVTRARTGVTVSVTRSQVAFRRRRGFAYLWRPGQYLRNPAAEVVLSIALQREIASARFKQVAHPAPAVWMHHLEIRSVDDLDHEVQDWLLEAADLAGAARPDPRKATRLETG